MPEIPLVVQRWCRYGHDRAYVKRGDADLGYRDLRTGEVVCSSDGDVAAVHAATQQLFDRVTAGRAPDDVPKHAQDHEPTPVVARPSPRPEPVEPRQPDQDLALNAPGEAVRAKALELRAEAPVRTFFARLVGAKTDERAFRVGADGEDEVARRLRKLDDRWRVLHSVPIGDRGSDIDHVVIGPTGVVTINVKKHPDAAVWSFGGTVKVNGFHQPYVRNSRFEAARAAKLLSVAAGFDVGVRAVVVFVGQRSLTVKQQPTSGEVSVLAGRDLVRWLTSSEVVLGAPSVTRIFEVARRLSTWRPNAVEVGLSS